jgi:hypothetical protein
MANYPVEIRRCRHVKTNGTQCGSPALKAEELCYYHQQNQPQEVELYLDGERHSEGSMVLPVFEDAHSIQTVIRQVVQLMLSRRIDRKDAGVLLYALQIASGNLKTMQAEKATPTRIVVELEKVGETPLGKTPWSASGQGHDMEEAPEEGEDNSLGRSASAEECYAAMSRAEKLAMSNGLQHRGVINQGDIERKYSEGGPDPVLVAMKRLREDQEQERMRNV